MRIQPVFHGSLNGSLSWLFCGLFALAMPACHSDSPRELPFPTFDARAPFPELSASSDATKSGAKGAKKGQSAYEKAIADSMNDRGPARDDTKTPPDATGQATDQATGQATGQANIKRQQVALPGGLTSSIPLNFEEWQWSMSGDATLISHRAAGAKEPDALIYAEGFSGLMSASPSLEVRRFEHEVDSSMTAPVMPQQISDALVQRLSKSTNLGGPQVRDALSRAASRTMGLGLNYASSEDSFTGWQWVGHNQNDVAVRLGRTFGYWLGQPRADAAAAGVLQAIAGHMPGLSEASQRYQQVVNQQPKGSGRTGWPAWMVLGSAVVDKDVGTHVAIMCKAPCTVTDDLADFLADLTLADTTHLDALRGQGQKTSLRDFAGEQGLFFK